MTDSAPAIPGIPLPSLFPTVQQPRVWTVFTAFAAVIAGGIAVTMVVIVGIVVIGIMPGIGEELLCRGYIQTRLSQRWGRTVSILVTAILFAILHMDPLQSTFAFGLGVYLGLITERTGSLRPAMVCH